MKWSDRFSTEDINRNLKTAYKNSIGKDAMNGNRAPKRYEFYIKYYGWDVPYLKKIEQEFGQYVSYSAYENLLKAIDSLEERGLGYWQGDEFFVYEDYKTQDDDNPTNWGE